VEGNISADHVELHEKLKENPLYTDEYESEVVREFIELTK
jgi:hypothetical protein